MMFIKTFTSIFVKYVKWDSNYHIKKEDMYRVFMKRRDTNVTTVTRIFVTFFKEDCTFKLFMKGTDFHVKGVRKHLLQQTISLNTETMFMKIREGTNANFVV